ncbi:nickel pincer cofactor biosynthesis protein LarB [Candidatus Bathyarchaeota archaeon]|nr:nickel pincer cofactor biosynthesis protein LarB [Candidatus Bathyarchaeota archaeon]
MRDILRKVAEGKLSIEEAEKLLKAWAIEEIGNLAKIDVGREFRKSIPEIILGEGKDPKDLAEITLKMLGKSGRAIVSRVTEEQVEAVKRTLPEDSILQVYEKARMLIVKHRDFRVEESGGKVGILAAGTSDVPVAEEARIIVEETGCKAIVAYDVGVAGIHRLLSPLKKMIEEDVDVIIVVAGREGALPSVVAGLVDIPVIAVPTSIGYGLGGKGVSALIAMLQSCSLGLAVVNIDGGVAAGAVATLIAKRVARFKKTAKNF